MKKADQMTKRPRGSDVNSGRSDNQNDPLDRPKTRRRCQSVGMMRLAERFLPLFVVRQLQRPTVRGILANISWLSGQQLLALIMSVLVGAWVARYLGPEKFGMLSYAVAIVGLFASLSTLGLDEIVVRELVKHPDDENEILGSAFVLVLLGSTLAFFLLILMSLCLFQDQPIIRWMIVIMGAGLMIQAVRPIDLWFRSQMLSKYPALAGSSALVVASAAKIGLILRQASILLFAVISTCQWVLYTLGVMLAFRKKGRSVKCWKPRRARAVHLIGESWPLIIASIAVVVYMKIDQVMLGWLVEHEAVGIYAAAVRISEVWYFIPTILASSVLPSIVRSRQLGNQIYKRRLQSYYDISFVLALGLTIPITFLAPFLVRMLFGSAYTGTGTILAIHIWASPFVFLGVARSAYLVSEGLLKFSACASIAGAIVNVALNCLLIPRFEGIGAAIATVVSQAVYAYLSSFFHPRLREAAHMQTRAFWSPARYILGIVSRRRA